MINNVVRGIADKIREMYPNSRIAYNPIRDVEPETFVITYLHGSKIGEPNNIDLFQYDFTVSFIPGILQNIPIIGQKDTRLSDSGEVNESLYELLQTIDIGGFRNDKKLTVQTYKRYTLSRDDIILLFFSLSFRARKYIESTKIETYDLEINTKIEGM